jgi:hypothetical protein
MFLKTTEEGGSVKKGYRALTFFYSAAGKYRKALHGEWSPNGFAQYVM